MYGSESMPDRQPMKYRMEPVRTTQQKRFKRSVCQQPASLVQPNKQHRSNKQERPAGPRVSRATVGAAEVGDDEFRVGDGVCREGGCMLTGDRCAQSLSRLADGKREGRVLLNLSKVCHRIPSPSWGRGPREPCLDGAGHGASSTDSRLPVVAVLLRGLGCRQFLFNQRGWCHRRDPSDI